jgi:hypothetical protein
MDPPARPPSRSLAVIRGLSMRWTARIAEALRRPPGTALSRLPYIRFQPRQMATLAQRILTYDKNQIGQDASKYL